MAKKKAVKRPKNTQRGDVFAPGQYVRIMNSKGETRGIRIVEKSNNGTVTFTTPPPHGTQPGDKVAPCEPGIINLDRIV